jgi:hypothetical protein
VRVEVGGSGWPEAYVVVRMRIALVGTSGRSREAHGVGKFGEKWADTGYGNR